MRKMKSIAYYRVYHSICAWYLLSIYPLQKDITGCWVRPHGRGTVLASDKRQYANIEKGKVWRAVDLKAGACNRGGCTPSGDLMVLVRRGQGIRALNLYDL